MRKHFSLFHPFLFALFPVLSLFLHNINQVPLHQVFIPIVVLLVFAALLIFVFQLIFKKMEKASLFVSIFIILFFSFGHICEFGRYSAFYVYGYLIFSLLILILILAAYLIKRAKRLSNITKIFNFLGIFLAAFPLINIVYYKIDTQIYLSSHKRVAVKKDFIGGGIKFESLPNIFYIILDGHTRQDVLKDVYNYDNREFIAFLEERGFFVAHKSFTNYCQTVLALPAALNMDYLNFISNKPGVHFGNPWPLIYMWRHNLVFDFLRQHGYRIITFDAQGWNVYLTPKDVDIFYDTPGVGVMDGFQSMLLDTTPIPFILTRICKFSDMRYAFLRKRILFTFDNLERIAKEKGPYLIFAHILSPHQPFLFGAGGEYIYPKMDRYTEWFTIPDGRDRQEYIREYRDQLIFIDKKMEGVIDKIISSSPIPPIIILQADHGSDANLDPESAKNTDQREKMGILNAYYFPDKDYSVLYESISPVNSFRVVLNHIFKTNLKLLEDRSYFSTWSKTYDFIEVTDRINPK